MKTVLIEPAWIDICWNEAYELFNNIAKTCTDEKELDKLFYTLPVVSHRMASFSLRLESPY